LENIAQEDNLQNIVLHVEGDYMVTWLRRVFGIKTHPHARPQGKTCILVKCDVGFKNHLCIRGSGGGLSWNKGQPLKNIGRDEWIWETQLPFTECEFKVLINDEHYEQGENHRIGSGKFFQYTPWF
jgi:hypothetical protein